MTIPFIDTHVHFWDLDDASLSYSWLKPEATHPILSDEELDQLRSSNYAADQYLKDIAGAGVLACVHVQAAIGIADPVAETAWLQAAADRTGFPQAIVGYADLAADNPREMLERHLEHPNFRGVRDYRFGDGDYLLDPRWQRGFRLLGELGLVASIDCTLDTMPSVASLLSAVPDTRVAIDHMGFPVERSDEYFERWRQGMASLAAYEQTVCKISEVGMVEHGWTVERMTRWVTSCIETFGPRRCMFGTNWPVEKLYSTYPELIQAYRDVIAACSQREQRLMLVDTAAEVYRLSVDE